MVGAASGWNLWVWLHGIGVVSGCCSKKVYIDILTIINFSYSTCISSFFGSSIPTSLLIFKMFFCYYKGGISFAGYIITHFKHHHRVAQLISNGINVHIYNNAIIRN